MKIKILKRWFLYLIIVIITLSCEKFVTIDPPIDKIGADKIFINDEMATSAIRGIYVSLASAGFANGGPTSVTLLAGRSSDDFTSFIGDQLRAQFSLNNILSTNTTIMQAGLWTKPYQIIYAANTVIENLAGSESVSMPTKVQLIAEAKFLRAFSYFYLTNLFGNVPLVLGTDYRVNASLPKSPQVAIYSQIIKDLEEASTDLSDNYPTAERTRVNKWVATAFLARVHLYVKNYGKAEEYATELIGKTDRYNLITDDINKVFLKNSQEAIWQLFLPVALGYNTFEGQVYILTAAPGTSTDVVISDNLYSAFEPGDQRQTKWVGTFTSGANKWYYPFKYKVKTGATPSSEYTMVMRMAEQYLIRAEARINQDKIDLGIADLNQIRSRARTTATVLIPNPMPALPTGMSKATALLAVEKERRIELFSEWGHRWLDLKRTGRANAILSIIKGANWQSTDELYPIPNSEILNNPNLSQNPGYNQ